MASPKSHFQIEVLRKVVSGIFDVIERDLGQSSVELPHSLYWSILDDAKYRMEQSPGAEDLGVGNLADDFEFVAAAHADPSQAIPLVLMHVAPLLSALSTAVPSYKPPPDKK